MRRQLLVRYATDHLRKLLPAIYDDALAERLSLIYEQVLFVQQFRLDPVARVTNGATVRHIDPAEAWFDH